MVVGLTLWIVVGCEVGLGLAVALLVGLVDARVSISSLSKLLLHHGVGAEVPLSSSVGLLLGLSVGLLVRLLVGFAVGFAVGLGFWIVFGLAVGMLTALLGLEDREAPVSSSPPPLLLHQGVGAEVPVYAAVGLAVGLVVGLEVDFAVGLIVGLAVG